MKVTYPPRVRLANLPTPVEAVTFPGVSERVRLFVKRDDLTESAAGGNKARKLEFLFAAARAMGADTVITCGGVQSNHARATALFAAKLAMRSVLVLRGDRPEDADGNLFLDYLAGAEVRFITREQWAARDEIMAGIGDELRTAGRRAYIIPEGGSNALGALGYLHAVEEMRDQLEELKVTPDYLVHATGSGGTQAGLVMGCRLFLPGARVMGVNVCDDEEYFTKKISAIIAEAEDMTGVRCGIDSGDIALLDGYVGRGYAVSAPEELQLITRVARGTGLVLDPVYTGKAFYGLTKEVEKGRFRENSTVLFVHTGGIFGCFPKRKEF